MNLTPLHSVATDSAHEHCQPTSVLKKKFVRPCSIPEFLIFKVRCELHLMIFFLVCFVIFGISPASFEGAACLGTRFRNNFRFLAQMW